jgi:hypothetical protein
LGVLTARWLARKVKAPARKKKAATSDTALLTGLRLSTTPEQPAMAPNAKR